MMEKRKLYKGSLVALLFLALTLCFAATALATDQSVNITQSDSVTVIQEKIQAAITAAGSSGVVTVSGSKTGVDETLDLDIPAGVTVKWVADYEGDVNELIKITGLGTFDVASGGAVKATGEESTAIYSAEGDVTVTGGSVMLAADTDQNKVIGVITEIVLTNIWLTDPVNGFVPQYQRVNICNTECKEVTYIFSPDFRDAYNRWLNGDGVNGADFDKGQSESLYTTFTDDAYWKDNAIAGQRGEQISQYGFKAGDMVELVLDKDYMIESIGNYAVLENDGKVKITGQSDRQRITIEGGEHSSNGTYTLLKDAVVFNVTTDDGGFGGASIISAASVLANDHIASKAVAFNITNYGAIKELYLVDIAHATRLGVVTAYRTDSGGGYYIIDDNKVYSDPIDVALPAVIWYTLDGDGNIVVKEILMGISAIDDDDNPVFTMAEAALAALSSAYDNGEVDYFPIWGKLENFNSSAKIATINSRNMYIYDTYFYDIVEDDGGRANGSSFSFPLRDKLGRQALALVDKNYDTLLLVVAGGAIVVVEGRGSVGAGGASGGVAYISPTTAAFTTPPDPASGGGGIVVVRPPNPYALGAAICAESGNVSVSGGQVKAAIDSGCAIYAKGENATVTVNGISNIEYSGDLGNAIYAVSGNVTVSGAATVKATGEGSCAIITAGNVSISGGTVQTSGDIYFGAGFTSVMPFAICSSVGDVAITGGKVSATGEYGCAIYCRNIEVSGGTVESFGKGGSAITSCEGNVNISGDALVQATGNYYDGLIYAFTIPCAIYAEGSNITVTGGTVKATGAGGVTIRVLNNGVAAYLIGSCNGSMAVEDNQGLIVAADTLSIPASRSNTATGLTVKAGGGSVEWDTTGAVPKINFTLDNSPPPKTLAWGEYFTTVETFSVNCYLAEGDEEPYNTQIIEGGECAVQPQDPEKEGYVFVGWYTLLDEIWSAWDFATEVYRDVDLYAKWEEESQPIINGLAASPATLVAAGGDSVITVLGTKLPAEIMVTAFEGSTPTSISGAASGSPTSASVTLTFPENASTSADKVYTIRGSLDDGETWVDGIATVTVSKAKSPDEPSIIVGGGGGGAVSNDATLSFAKADFDLSDAKDISVSLTLNGRALNDLKNSAYTLKIGADYTLSNRTVTIKTSYLSTLDIGTQIIDFVMNGGKNPQLIITVKDSAQVEESAISVAARASKFAPFIQGFENNTFRGTSPITREQFVAILYRLNNVQPLPKADKNNPSFKDVAPARWSYDAIEWALKVGIAVADGGGNFRPPEPLTRAEMAVMLVKADNLTQMAENTFSDLDDHPDKDDILKAVAAKIFTGYTDGSFKPEGNSTRAEAVTALIRYLLEGEPTDEMWQSIRLNFSDVSRNDWAYKYIALAVKGR